MKKNAVVATGLVIILLMAASCSTLQTRKEKGTATGVAVGAAAGAALGQAIGRNTASTLWGAAIGAVVGGIAGHEIASYMDRQEEELRQMAAQSEAMTVSRTRDVLTATFRGDVLFDFDSAVIKPGAYAELDRVAKVLNDFPETAVRVEGHTDASGSEAYNQQLSEKRAQAVKNALVQRGVNPARIHAVGFGESMPVSSVAALNRRVNIVIIPIESS
ncbi:MAG: OmpA family protein [Deltaproteobacteria bacterium]|nr:OmpA family protein [Deltaproteobacteria bacterium]MBW2070482.1 OmpA family protein [Deltaproteobacteria bacterium]